jgi:hypothetical protein
MTDLFDQLKDVIRDSSPTNDSTDGAATADHSTDDAQADSGAVDDGKTKDSRSIDNVRGEILRKFGDFQAEVRGTLAEIKGQLSTSAPASSAKPSSLQDQLNQYTADQLEQLRSTLPEDQRSAIDPYIQRKRVKEEVDQRFSAFTESYQTKSERDRFNSMAVARYPDLYNLASDFAREVDARIKQQPESVTKNNPRLVLDIANDVAIERGMKPQARRVIQGTGRQGFGSRTAPANQEDAAGASGGLSDEKHDAISKALQAALPRGQKFDRKAIREREKNYSGKMIQINRDEQSEV